MTYVLTIAGSDSSSRVGIAADLEAFAAQNCVGSMAITCITAQAVGTVYPLPPAVVAAQIDAAFGEHPIKAVKVGMVYNAAIISAVAERLRFWRPAFIVIDPLLASSTGIELLEEEARESLIDQLFPLATLVTPNLPESEIFTAKTMLIKGGHREENRGWDCLIREGEAPYWFKSEGLFRKRRGTGCRLSSAIAACLAKGASLKEAIFQAKDYLHAYLS